MRSRSQVVASLHRHLLRRGLPRFQMTVIVVATGLAGFGVSAALLALGLSSMPVRYAVAMLAAYAVFLLLVRLWAEYQRHRLELDADVVDLLPDLPSSADGTTGAEPWVGGGGRFGGGGAGRRWDGATHTTGRRLRAAPARRSTSTWTRAG